MHTKDLVTFKARVGNALVIWVGKTGPESAKTRGARSYFSARRVTIAPHVHACRTIMNEACFVRGF
jgi:hypothetical protein